ncbi:MAG: carbon-phosphorus lyase complex subunit PhnI [Solirubrobacterales bacterium]|nr:carbon-phosphorus lyase complex subunit PhnI [Solirubrobacterales bacterium]
MAYTAVRGGEAAVEAAGRIEREYAAAGTVSAEDVQTSLPYLVDQVISEARLYAPELAARAIAEARGDVAEAVFLLRAYRSTLDRVSNSLALDTDTMRVTRRISSAFKDIPGGQLLGGTRDYTQRLLGRGALAGAASETETDVRGDGGEGLLPRVTDLLRDQGLVAERSSDEDPEEPYDLTRQPLRIPTPRSGRLQGLAGSETGAISALAYSSMRGFGPGHPVPADFRIGYLPLLVEHPYADVPVEIGEIYCTECEMVHHAEDEPGSGGLGMGYGFTLGRNERKAISMAILDDAIEVGNARATGPAAPAEDEEFVLYHVDGLESTGFLEHLKLPHYVTFQSGLDRLRYANMDGE